MRELLGLDKPKEAEKPSRKLDEEQVHPNPHLTLTLTLTLTP